jgi:sulfate transport system permease protein
MATNSHPSFEEKHLSRAVMDPRWSRWLLCGAALLFLALLLVVPLAAVFAEALRKGIGPFLDTFASHDARHAVMLTLIVAGISVPLNIVFGLAASWAITRHDFPGKSFLITLIDLPFSVSPVVSGLILVLVFGIHGWFGPLIQSTGLQIIFAVPGIVLATVFITFPFVARELIPAMEATGREEEQAAVMLGASGWQILRRITLPNVRWALLYGVLLCNARAMGEFGAVSVVSGHIRGETNTVPLHVEILYNEYNFVAAFSMASILALLALLTLVAKTALEWRMQQLQHQVVTERTRHRDPVLTSETH